MEKSPKNKILWDSCLLCNLLLGEINKFEFRLLFQESIMKTSNGSRFCIRRRKKLYNISKRSSQSEDSDFNCLRPFRIFLESQNSKGRYESRKILGFHRKKMIFFENFEIILLFLLFFNYFGIFGFFSIF